MCVLSETIHNFDMINYYETKLNNGKQSRRNAGIGLILLFCSEKTLIRKISTQQLKRNYVGQHEILIKFVRAYKEN